MRYIRDLSVNRAHWHELVARVMVTTLLISTLSSCTRKSTEPSGRGIRMLFIGNSLVASNSLPDMVQAVGLLMGDTVYVREETAGSTALIDHFNGATRAVQALREDTWDFVVLSQGPTPRGICRDSLVLWTNMFDSLVRESGGRSALLMTWPAAQARPDLFDEVRESFQQAAHSVNGIFLPAGEAWRIAWSVDSSIPLYSADGFHPSALGSLLAALEIHGRLSERNMRTLSVERLRMIAPAATSTSQLRILIDAAQAANERFHSTTDLPSFEYKPAAAPITQSC
jgi:hypothetical protein